MKTASKASGPLDDTREGVNAFLEKREPQWRNK